jgi:hypothetical protein
MFHARSFQLRRWGRVILLTKAGTDSAQRMLAWRGSYAFPDSRTLEWRSGIRSSKPERLFPAVCLNTVVIEAGLLPHITAASRSIVGQIFRI